MQDEGAGKRRKKGGQINRHCCWDKGKTRKGIEDGQEHGVWLRHLASIAHFASLIMACALMSHDVSDNALWITVLYQHTILKVPIMRTQVQSELTSPQRKHCGSKKNKTTKKKHIHAPLKKIVKKIVVLCIKQEQDKSSPISTSTPRECCSPKIGTQVLQCRASSSRGEKTFQGLMLVVEKYGCCRKITYSII